MKEAEITKLYNAKKEASFKAKLKMYLFFKAINGTKDISFESFNCSDVVEIYTTQFCQYLDDEIIKLEDNTSIRVGAIDKNTKKIREELGPKIGAWKKDYKDNFENILSLTQFETILKKGKCCYCGITEKEIDRLIDKSQLFKKVNRGFKLEIERFDSNIEYSYENMDLACYWCNNSKTDEFTKEEFEPVGKAIREIWNKRLNK